MKNAALSGKPHVRFDEGEVASTKPRRGVLLYKILQVVPSIGAESSGPSYSVPGLCNGLLAAGCEVSLHFGGNMPARSFPYPVTCSPFSRFPHPRLGRSPMMEEVLLEAVKSVDIVQNNSFWMYPNVYAYRAIKHLKKIPGARLPKLVNAPRGTLASWALNHHKLQKRLFGFLAGQYAAMKATDMWHATCKKEYEEIRAAGFTQPVAIVPIGMDIPNVEYAQATGSPKSGHRVAFFGRLHKVKNIDMLVKAWHVIFGGECDKGLDDWELVIAGPDGGVRGDLEAYIADHRIPRVRFVGEINGPAKYEFLSQADLYVLPSKTENFGITLAEALACGTPALGSRGTPWEALNEWRCGSWGFSTAEELAVELEKLMRVTDAERRAMGCRGQELIRSRYSWAAIGQQMKCAYQWLLDPAREARPDWVLMD